MVEFKWWEEMEWPRRRVLKVKRGGGAERRRRTCRG